MGLFEQLGERYHVTDRTAQTAVMQTPEQRLSYFEQQRQLGKPLEEKVAAMIQNLNAYVPWTEVTRKRGPFARLRAAREQAKLETEEAQIISGYGYLDGNKDRVVRLVKDCHRNTTIYHNGVMMLYFNDFHPSGVDVPNRIGMLAGVELDTDRAAAIGDYLDQLEARVDWQSADVVSDRSAFYPRSDSFYDMINPMFEPDDFRDQF